MTTSSTTSATPTLSPERLAERLAEGDALTVLDVRDDAAWGIEAPGVIARHVPAATVLADPARVARELDGPVAVVCNRGLSARSVAGALRPLGVDAAVVEGGMRGWIATLAVRDVELGIDGLAVRQVQRPGRGCLSYVLASAGRALVVDPAPDAAFYSALAAGLGARITDVVDTHLHADHLSGARALAESTGATVRLPAAALERGVAYAASVEPLHDGDVIALGSVEVRALALPGHTTDMTGLLVSGRALVGGDSLFADGIARPDLQRGDPDGARAMARTLHATLHERVLALGDDVLLLPGHAHPGVHAAAIAPTLGAVRAAVEELAIEDPGAFAEVLLADMPPRPANYEAIIGVNAGHHPFDPELETGGNSCSTR
jgi:glyoxylase-like metal-dependent hydrolase (beta-lactamase superfamily II)/rhodanese-related sulfurtransferase